jgi:hypothetical protein
VPLLGLSAVEVECTSDRRATDSLPPVACLYQATIPLDHTGRFRAILSLMDTVI